MIIRKIRMVNFRGFRDKTIDFQDKPVVLLSAANGIGKTTTIDAIEWCLTGDIGRLKASFDTRSTNDTDRKKNSAGILKHRDAGKNAKVRVELSLFDGEKEVVLCREQKKDELNPEESKVTIDNSKDKAEAFIREYIGDSFYNFHFCDIQKSFHVQNTKRDKLKDLFGEFITNYDAQKQIAENLAIFADDVSRHIEDATNEKKRLDVKIELLEGQVEKNRQNLVHCPYPEIRFYPDEETQIDGLSQEAMFAQKERLKACGYQAAKKELDKLVSNEASKSRLATAKILVSYWETQSEAILRALDAGFPESTVAAIAELEKKLGILRNLSLSENTIIQDGEMVIALGNDSFTQSGFEALKAALREKEQRIQELSAEIDLLSKNNKVLKLLSSLTAKKQTVIAYRDSAVAENGFVRCPVCGSESFADMEAASILQEAEAYIRQNGDAVKAKAEAKVSLQAEVDGIYQELIRRAKAVVTEAKQELTAQIRDWKDLKDLLQPYFNAAAQFLPDIQVKEMTEEKARELLHTVEGSILAQSDEQKAQNAYRQLLTVLGYRYENETVQQTCAMVTQRNSKPFEISNFSYEIFVSKLNAINSRLADRAQLDLVSQLDEQRNKKIKLDGDITDLRALEEKATRRAAAIKEIVEALSADEYKKVGPALSKFYNKLARYNADNGIHIRLESEGISLVDNNGKNIVNVLSNGQISVFMLAYFFAGINARNDREKMKVYFIDDLTACMDDVNMLAFMDLLKYQMSSKATMEQLFFITCDDRISNLLRYKLTGHGIELCELGEADFKSKPIGNLAGTV